MLSKQQLELTLDGFKRQFPSARFDSEQLAAAIINGTFDVATSDPGVHPYEQLSAATVILERHLADNLDDCITIEACDGHVTAKFWSDRRTAAASLTDDHLPMQKALVELAEKSL